MTIRLHGATMSDFTIIGTYSVFIASYVVFALGKFPGMKTDRPEFTSFISFSRAPDGSPVCLSDTSVNETYTMDVQQD